MKKIWLIALLPLARFDLPYREGHDFEIEENKGKEIVELGYAKLKEDPEQEAKAKADAEAKAKQEAEEKAKAEQEAKAKAKTGK